LVMNAVGAIATGATVLVVAVAKFVEGAWITLLLIPAIIAFMVAIRRHYDRVAREVSCPEPLNLDDLQQPLVVVALDEWNKVTQKAIRFAMTLSQEVQVVHVDAGEKSDRLKEQWDEW